MYVFLIDKCLQKHCFRLICLSSILTWWFRCCVQWCSRRSVPNGLAEQGEVGCVSWTGEGTPTIGEITLRDDAMGGASLLKVFLPFESFMGVQVGLWFDVNVSTWMIYKDTSPFVLVVFTFFPVGVRQSPTRVALKMIHGYGRSWKKVIGFNRVDGGRDSVSDSTRHGLATLLGKLTGCAHRAMSQFGGRRVKTPAPFRVAQ